MKVFMGNYHFVSALKVHTSLLVREGGGKDLAKAGRQEDRVKLWGWGTAPRGVRQCGRPMSLSGRIIEIVVSMCVTIRKT